MFVQEFIISGYIILGLLYSCFSRFLTDQAIFEKKKKNFFILINIAIVILIVCWLLTFLTFFTSPFYIFYPILEQLRILQDVDSLINETFGNVFFRYDYVSNFFTLILISLFIFYLQLLKQLLKKTTVLQKYILEIPILLLVIFLSLKLFLITYDLIIIVLTLELASFCSIILLAVHLTTKENVFSLEAAIKYFVFNAVSVILLLLSISGYYLFFKSINILDFNLALKFNPLLIFFNVETLMFFHFCFFFSFFIKLGVAPFHFWVPDVYEGSELIMTAFLVLIISPILLLKFLIFTKLLLPIFELKHYFFIFFLILGFISISVGTFNAMHQYKTKRFLAYTGISHLGYILISLSTGTYLGFLASFFYLFVYIITNIIFFTLILLVRQSTNIPLLFLNQFKLVLNQNIYILILCVIPIFSYAGFPPFLGFFAKLFVIISLLDLNYILLTCCLIFFIVINGYLYLRFIKMMVFEETSVQLYFPVTNLNFSKDYYNIKFSFLNTNACLINNNFLLIIIFFLGLILSFGGLIAPKLLIFLVKPIMSLLLFY